MKFIFNYLLLSMIPVFSMKLSLKRSFISNKQLINTQNVFGIHRSAFSRLSMSNIWTVDKVRSTFVNYFEKKHNHVNFISSPVVPLNDPTLLFANSGMTQFKPIFVGTVDPSSPLASLSRAVNTQKCNLSTILTIKSHFTNYNL